MQARTLLGPQSLTVRAEIRTLFGLAHPGAPTTIRYERVADQVVRVVLDRPEVANALNVQTFVELDEALDRIERDDDVRVWMLTGAPRSDGRPWFSAGADMKESQAPAGGHPSRFVDPAAVVDRIDDLLKPSIAVIAGFCTTGALELAMACDLRLAAASARLSDWHLRTTGLGIGQWGAAVRLSRLVGIDKAKQLLLTGVEVDGAEAQRIGLVSRTVPDPRVESEALELASTIASMPPKGVRTTLAFLGLQEDMSKHDAAHWARLAPALTGLHLRPFADAADRFFDRRGK
jgi:enoyl-CoA hydratase/carnithine racemase